MLLVPGSEISLDVPAREYLWLFGYVVFSYVFRIDCHVTT